MCILIIIFFSLRQNILFGLAHIWRRSSRNTKRSVSVCPFLHTVEFHLFYSLQSSNNSFKYHVKDDFSGIILSKGMINLKSVWTKLNQFKVSFKWIWNQIELSLESVLDLSSSYEPLKRMLYYKVWFLKAPKKEKGLVLKLSLKFSRTSLNNHKVWNETTDSKFLS